MSQPTIDATPLAARALELVPDNSTIGLGTGHAAEAFLQVLAERVQSGFRVRGVPTSVATEQLARRLGIPLVSIEDTPSLDFTIDGADEVSPQGDLIKGYGGALVREKVVASITGQLIILVGEEKLVPKLGHRGRVPVEIVPFAAGPVKRAISGLGYSAELRGSEETPFSTDNGNWILDVAVKDLSDPAGLDSVLYSIPGVIGTGLFLNFRPRVLVLSNLGVRESV